MTKNDKIKVWVTLALAIVGGILSMAENIVNIPGIGNVANWATTVIALALSAKQVLTLILDRTNINTILAFGIGTIAFTFTGCQTSLEGLSKDQKFEIIKARESRASIWTSVGSGLAQGLGGAAVGWANSHSNAGSSSKPLPNDSGLRK